MSNTDRRILVVGGTGMLMPLCASLPPNELILAARFVSHSGAMDRLFAEVMCVPLDYTDGTSQSKFLEQFTSWTGLKVCVLWVHSNAWGFSKRVIEAASRCPEPPLIVHVFGSNHRPNDLALWSRERNTRFTAIQLGSVQTSTGTRWLTYQEISRKVAAALSNEYPNLYNLSSKPPHLGT